MDFGEVSGARLALQALEVLIVRIEIGKHVDDFIGHEHAPTVINTVRDAVEDYRSGAKPKEAILDELRSFTARFCSFLEERGLPMEFVRQTGVAEAAEELRQKGIVS